MSPHVAVGHLCGCPGRLDAVQEPVGPGTAEEHVVSLTGCRALRTAQVVSKLLVIESARMDKAGPASTTAINPRRTDIPGGFATAPGDTTRPRALIPRRLPPKPPWCQRAGGSQDAVEARTRGHDSWYLAPYGSWKPGAGLL